MRRPRPRRWSRRRTCRRRAGSSIRCICASRRSPSSPYVRQRGRIRKARVEVQAVAKKAKRIDRDAAWKAKRDALESVYRVKRSAGRELAYAAYRAAGRAAASTTSPPGVRSPSSTATTGTSGPRNCSIRHAPRSPISPPSTPKTVDFHRWLQWQLDDQLTAAQATAVQAGMELGVMHDLAVGVDPNGADAWALQDVLALGVTAGAPPDEFNQLGQDWSQPPWRPDQLVDHALRAVPRPGQRGAAARGRRSHRPHHRAVPAVVDPEGRACRPTAPMCATTTRR